MFVQCSLRIVGRIGQRLPFVAVIQPQHHHAPIQILRARHNAVGKCGREHRLVAQHQFADAAGLHAVGHARGGFGGMLRQTAKRRTAARHGDKQHHHRQQGQAEGRQAVPQCVAAGHFVTQGQGTRHQNQAEQRPQASEQAFVKQNGAGQQKHHHHDHDLPIAAGAAFVAFQQCQQQQERHAALQAENRPELLHDQQKHAQQQHAVLPRFQAADAFIQQSDAQQHERAENHIHPHRQLPQQWQRHGHQRCQGKHHGGETRGLVQKSGMGNQQNNGLQYNNQTPMRLDKPSIKCAGCFFSVFKSSLHINWQGIQGQIRRIRSPRPIPAAPVRTVSKIVPLAIFSKKLSSLPVVPVTSMV